MVELQRKRLSSRRDPPRPLDSDGLSVILENAPPFDAGKLGTPDFHGLDCPSFLQQQQQQSHTSAKSSFQLSHRTRTSKLSHEGRRSLKETLLSKSSTDVVVAAAAEHCDATGTSIKINHAQYKGDILPLNVSRIQSSDVALRPRNEGSSSENMVKGLETTDITENDSHNQESLIQKSTETLLSSSFELCLADSAQPCQFEDDATDSILLTSNKELPVVNQDIKITQSPRKNGNNDDERATKRNTNTKATSSPRKIWRQKQSLTNETKGPSSPMRLKQRLKDSCENKIVGLSMNAIVEPNNVIEGNPSITSDLLPVNNNVVEIKTLSTDSINASSTSSACAKALNDSAGNICSEANISARCKNMTSQLGPKCKDAAVSSVTEHSRSPRSRTMQRRLVCHPAVTAATSTRHSKRAIGRVPALSGNGSFREKKREHKSETRTLVPCSMNDDSKVDTERGSIALAHASDSVISLINNLTRKSDTETSHDAVGIHNSKIENNSSDCDKTALSSSSFSRTSRPLIRSSSLRKNKAASTETSTNRSNHHHIDASMTQSRHRKANDIKSLKKKAVNLRVQESAVSTTSSSGLTW